MHDTVHRILQIYQALNKRLNRGEFPQRQLAQTVDIAERFIHEHHEIIEERFLFPVLKEAKKRPDLVVKLSKHHDEARTITTQLRKLVAEKQDDQQSLTKIANLLKKFVALYTSHEAQEAAELMPEIRALLSAGAVAGFSDMLETAKGILPQIDELEKELEITQ